MFNIFKQLKEKEEELERLRFMCKKATDVSDNYSGWTFAYKNAIWELSKNGVITSEQCDLLFSKAREYYEYWQTH